MTEMSTEKALEPDERLEAARQAAEAMCEQDPEAARNIACAVQELLAGSNPAKYEAAREQLEDELVRHARSDQAAQYWERTMRVWAMRCWYAGHDAGYRERQGEERAGTPPVTYDTFLSMLGEGMHTGFRKTDGAFLYAIHRLIRESPPGDWHAVCEFAGSFIWAQLRDGGTDDSDAEGGSPFSPQSSVLRLRAALGALPAPRGEYGEKRRRLVMRHLDEALDILDEGGESPWDLP